MKYLMLIYGNESIWSSLPAEDFEGLVARVDGFTDELRRTGELVDCRGLGERPRSVRVRDGDPVVSDGPYLEAKEHVGSYLVVDVADEARAVEIARSYPGIDFGARSGGLELWPLMEGDGA